jgi:hypothetical protein
MIRIALIVLALVAPFLMPWQYAAVLALAASFYMPPVALIVGAVSEALYGTGTVPYAFLVGLVGMLFMYGVRRFVEARIMSA